MSWVVLMKGNIIKNIFISSFSVGLLVIGLNLKS